MDLIKCISIYTIITSLLQVAVHIFLFDLIEYKTYDRGVIDLMYGILQRNSFYDLLFCSFAFNGVWLITSIILAYFAWKNTTQLLKVFGIIWTVFAILNFILDLVIIILYIEDIKISYTNWGIYYDDYLVAYTSLLLIFARGVIILIINFCTLIGMLIKITNKDLQKKAGNRYVSPTGTHLEGENLPRIQDGYNHYEQHEEINRNEYPPVKTDIPRFNPHNIAYEYSNFNEYDPTPSYRKLNNNRTSSNTNMRANGVPSDPLRHESSWSYRPNLKTSQGLPRLVPNPHEPVPDYNLRQPRSYPRRDLQQQNRTQYM